MYLMEDIHLNILKVIDTLFHAKTFHFIMRCKRKTKKKN